ncbi:putative ydaA protein [Escherichia coli 2-177-06_S1_C2]|nr:putative ydaA protein [Escherichia coli 2-177-06_S1_C2]
MLLCCSFICCSDSDYCSVVLSAGRTFGSRLPGGIRSSGPTPTGSCWRTRQSPPNPLARFRAVATVRCVKTPGLQRPFRSRRLCRAVACAPGIPAKGLRDVRRNAVSRTRSSSLQRAPAHCLPGATHPYESLSPGADTATTCRTDCPG